MYQALWWLTMAVIALKCPEIDVRVVDINKQKIKDWNSKDLNKLPIYESGLAEIISKTRGKNLFSRLKLLVQLTMQI